MYFINRIVMHKKFFVTTPIYYTNGVPHIGHSYSSLLADILARYKRLLWYDVKFSTWVDEHAQKIYDNAQKNWTDVYDFLDEMASQHKAVWDGLEISYTDFIRTSESRHHAFVREILQKTYKAGYFYEKEYEWLYCVWCESFKKESDLVNGRCPEHPQMELVMMKEKNRFFKLSHFQKELEKLHEETDLIYPSFRWNEIRSFIKSWLEDFSISRNKTFGIKLPFDEDQVAYVWYDALLNYLTVCQWGHENYWPAVHIMGKDIVRFHAIYWPAMLLAAWYTEMPRKIITTWFFTIDGQKISKSLGNVIDPVELVQKYNRDALTLYLFSDLQIWNDGDVSLAKFVWNYDSILLWGWGNLVSRVTKIAQKNMVTTARVNDASKSLCLRLAADLGYKNQLLEILLTQRSSIWNYLDQRLENYDINWLLSDIISIVNVANKYIDYQKPWEKLKTPDLINEAKQDIEFLLYLIVWIWVFSSPYFIKWWRVLQSILGNKELHSIWDNQEASESVRNYLTNNDIYELALNPWVLYQKTQEENQ